ncbi:hypothetical protein D1AOALGA4SA_9665 [Olavius algarvensis Delta 1 endosymbiont]|nr:hypothetical protein D1AOALGA4SA_9665 [Olavius algarvensis Delta 1 endosymbiont]
MTNDGIAPLSRFKIERIPQFDIRQSTFDICPAGVSFPIRSTVIAGGWSDT